MAGKTKPDTRDVQVTLNEILWTDQQMRYLNVMINKFRYSADIASVILTHIFSEHNGPTRGRRSNNPFSMENYQKHQKLHDNVVINANKGNIAWLKQTGNDQDAKEREMMEAHIELVAEDKGFEIHKTANTVEDDDTNLALAAQQDEEHAAKKRKQRRDAQAQDQHTDTNVSNRASTRAQTHLPEMAAPWIIANTNDAGINSARAVDSGNNQPRGPFATSPMDQMMHQRAFNQLLRYRAGDSSYVRSRLAASETVNTEAPAMNNTALIADEGSSRNTAIVTGRAAQEDIMRTMSAVVEAGPDGEQDFDVQVTTTTQRITRLEQGPASAGGRARMSFLIEATMTIKSRQPPQ